MGLRIAILCAGLMVACGGGDGDHSIDTSRYSRGCSVDADCVGVYQGTLGCCGGGCPNAAIAVTDHDAYVAALAAQTPMCNPAPPCADQTVACEQKSALCVGGMCTLAVTSAGALSAPPSVAPTR